ncbi:MAG: glutamate 5-kinase [Rikenellaceae bacterium]
MKELNNRNKKCNRVVVKIGSNVLTRKDGTLDSTRISALTDQVVELYKNGIEVIMISSGAVASGRSELSVGKKLDSVSARQLYSAVGQTKLIQKYYNLFREYGIVCGQILTTKDGLSTRRHYLNQQQCMRVMLENGVVPIVNENDTVSVTELMFTDNDELSGLISAMMNADKLIILSNIDGIYNGDPSAADSKVVREIIPNKTEITNYISTSKSQFGRGGMLTKSRISCKVALEGIEVVIANGKKDNILTRLLLSDEDVVCTRFVPSDKPVSGLKKWIAHSEGFKKGSLHINQGAYDALLGSQAKSLLPVGVTKVSGEFEKDDIVEIISPQGACIGVGRVSISHSEAALIAGEKGHKPMVHYDYLYIDNL